MMIKPTARGRARPVRYSAGMCLRWFRLLIVCGLALSVPLQGLAAAGMRWCHAGQAMAQPMPVGLAPQAQAPHHAAAAAASDIAPCHAAMALADAPSPAADATNSAAEDSSHRPSDAGLPSPAKLKTPHSCAGCAACVMGATLPASLPRLPGQVQATQALPAWVSSATVGHISAGLERPPRRFFA